MSRLVVAAMVFLFVGEVEAQHPASQQESQRGGYFGAPVLKYTSIRGQGALMLGGRGGWNLTPSVVLGGGAYGTVTEIDARERVMPEAPGPLDVKLETFGIDVEYAPRPASPTHVTFTLFTGGAAAHNVNDETKDQEGETDFIFLLEPSAGVERRLTDSVHFNLALSYRLVSGVEQPGLSAGDLQGASAVLALKWGKF
jgi:hypothetical protein